MRVLRIFLPALAGIFLITSIGNSQPLPVTNTARAFGTLLAKSAPLVYEDKRTSTIKRAQRRLIAWGYNPGTVDGIMGTQTQLALLAFQTDLNLRKTGKPDQEALGWLSLPPETAGKKARQVPVPTAESSGAKKKQGPLPEKVTTIESLDNHGIFGSRKAKGHTAAAPEQPEKFAGNDDITVQDLLPLADQPFSQMVQAEAGKIGETQPAPASTIVETAPAADPLPVIIGHGITIDSCTLKPAPTPAGGDLAALPPQTTIDIIGEEGDFLRVRYQGREGFVYASCVTEQ